MCRRSSSAGRMRARLTPISLAWRRFQFSGSRALSLVAIRSSGPLVTVVALGLLYHSFSVCGVQPILLAIEMIADHRDACSCSKSTTSRTERARTSGENCSLCCLSSLHLLKLEPPVCRKSLTLPPRTVSREPPGSPCPLVGLGAVRATDRQPEQLTGDAHAYPAGQEQAS